LWRIVRLLENIGISLARWLVILLNNYRLFSRTTLRRDGRSIRITVRHLQGRRSQHSTDKRRVLTNCRQIQNRLDDRIETQVRSHGIANLIQTLSRSVDHGIANGATGSPSPRDVLLATLLDTLKDTTHDLATHYLRRRADTKSIHSSLPKGITNSLTSVANIGTASFNSSSNTVNDCSEQSTSSADESIRVVTNVIANSIDPVVNQIPTGLQNLIDI